MIRHGIPLAAVAAAGLWLSACTATEPEPAPRDAAPIPATALHPAPPIELAGTGYDRAAQTAIRAAAPTEHPGLHNVFALSDNIVSGSEPQGEEGFRSLEQMGVRAILTVDGKVPDQEAAARHGIRYVHLPIQYKGISDDEIARIAKTFREIEGPVYVHCFHGKHRGPAAAAIGRIVIDGVSREQALAEMKQCGVSPKYEGLYHDIATKPMPAADETAALEFDFPAAHRAAGIVPAMVGLARTHDNLVLLCARGFEADPEHPDLDPLNEAQKLADAYRGILAMEEFATEPEELQGWMRRSAEESERLLALVRSVRGGDARAVEPAKQSWGQVKQLCDTCHAPYRN